MRLPRMTTRRWLLTVLLVAVMNASCLRVWRWRLRSRYVAAQYDHFAFRKYYDEGRVTPLKYFEKSEALMAAELALAGEDERRAIVSSHIARVLQVMRQEEDDLLTCHRSVACFEEAREYLEDLVLGPIIEMEPFPINKTAPRWVVHGVQRSPRVR
jgi:hypothetical protein